LVCAQRLDFAYRSADADNGPTLGVVFSLVIEIGLMALLF